MIVAPFMHHVTLSTMAHQADVDVNALIPVPEPEGAVELTPELTNHSEPQGKPRVHPTYFYKFLLLISIFHLMMLH